MERLLTEVCRVQYGFPFDSSKFSNKEGIPVIRIRDVVRGYSETYTSEVYNKDYVVNNGDILVGMDGEFNVGKWQGGYSLLNQRVCRLFPTEAIDSDYLFYFMPSILKKIEEKTPFATVKHLSAQQINKIIVPYPSLQKQHKIAEQFNYVDTILSAQRKILKLLDELVKSRDVGQFDWSRIGVI